MSFHMMRYHKCVSVLAIAAVSMTSCDPDGLPPTPERAPALQVVGGEGRDGTNRDAGVDRETLPTVHASVGATDGVARDPSVPRERGSRWEADARLSSFTVGQRFGWSSMADSGRPLTVEESRLSGGMLGAVAAIAEGPGESLYVLDANFLKIVVFKGDGTLLRVIPGGYGRGPGEFIRPRDIVLSNDGRIFVLESEQPKIEEFDTTGAYIKSIPIDVGLPLALAYSHERFYVSRLYRANQAAILVFDEGGTRIDSLLPATKQSGELSIFGSPGILNGEPDGQLTFASPLLGKWTNIRGDEQATHGTELFPGMEGRFITVGGNSQVRVVPAAPLAVGALPDGGILLIYQQHDMEARNSAGRNSAAVRANRETVHYLARFAPTGERVDIVEIETGRASLAISGTGTSFYLSVTEPFPQVVRFDAAR